MHRYLITVIVTTAMWACSFVAFADETISLFDGKTLDGWVTLDGKPVTNGWEVKDGNIHLKQSKKRAGYIRSTQTFDNFTLEFEWKIAKGGNSGLKYLASPFPPGGKRFYGCEFQLLDDDNHRNGRNPLTSAGALYGLYAPDESVKSLKDVDQFNSAKIVVHNGHIEHWLNGQKILEADVGSPDWDKRIRKSKFSDLSEFAVGPGVIMLQDHKSEVWFRNIKIRAARVRDSGGTGN